MTLLGAYGWDASNGHDDSGNGRDATPAPTLTYVTGKTGSGKAISASGDSNVNVATIAGIGPTSAVTVAGWFRRTSGNFHHLLASRPDATGNDPAVGLWGGDTGDAKPSFAVGTAVAKATTTMDTGWHYIAGVYDSAGGGLKFYIDDTTTPAATAARTGAIPTYGAGAWCLFNLNSGAGFWTNADCDDFRIYDTALSPAALAADKAASVTSSGGTPLTATSSATPPNIYVGGTSVLKVVPAGGAGGAQTFGWEPLAGTPPTATLSGADTAELTMTPSAPGTYGYRCTIARGSETITKDVSVTVQAVGSTGGVASVNRRNFTRIGSAATDLESVSDALPDSGLQSPDFPVDELFDGDVGAVAAPNAGVPFTMYTTGSRFQSGAGQIVAKLYQATTLRSTVTVQLPAGTVAGQATTRLPVSWPAADLTAVPTSAWTDGLMKYEMLVTVTV